jgi:hypothetical protein
MSKTTNKDIAMVVTTEKRGVFFGWAPADSVNKEKMRLRDARLCVSWSADVKGFMGLAAKGPTKGCRIGPIAPAITAFDITSAIECTPEAVEAWEKAPWC